MHFMGFHQYLLLRLFSVLNIYPLKNNPSSFSATLKRYFQYSLNFILLVSDQLSEVITFTRSTNPPPCSGASSSSLVFPSLITNSSFNDSSSDRFWLYFETTSQPYHYQLIWQSPYRSYDGQLFSPSFNLEVVCWDNKVYNVNFLPAYTYSNSMWLLHIPAIPSQKPSSYSSISGIGKTSIIIVTSFHPSVLVPEQHHPLVWNITIQDYFIGRICIERCQCIPFPYWRLYFIQRIGAT